MIRYGGPLPLQNVRFNTDNLRQWLTQGRNSCPLCRSQGVDEKEQPATESEDGEDTVADADVRPESADALQHHGAAQQAF